MSHADEEEFIDTFVVKDVKFIRIDDPNHSLGTPYEAPAKAGSSIGEITFEQHASYGGTLQNFFYSEARECIVHVIFSITFNTKATIEQCIFTCELGTRSSDSLMPGSAGQNKLRFVRWHPRRLDEENKTEVSVREAFDLGPRAYVSNLIVPGFALGSVNAERTYSYMSGWDITGARGDGPREQDRCEFVFSKNLHQRSSVTAEFDIGLVVEHSNTPFYIDFTFRKTLTAFENLWRGRSYGAVTRRRHFFPEDVSRRGIGPSQDPG